MGQAIFWDFNPFNRLAIVDYGDVQYAHGNPADMVEKTQRQVAEILEDGSEVLCLGGDHFISLPVFEHMQMYMAHYH